MILSLLYSLWALTGVAIIGLSVVLTLLAVEALVQIIDLIRR